MFRSRSTYVYLALAIGLLCYAFIDRKNLGTTEQQNAETRLYDIQPDDVTGLEINNVHGVFIFKKKNDHWEIKAPVDTLADAGTVNEVINQIAFSEPQRIIPMDSSDKNMAALKDWGLSPAVERVVIHTKGKNFELLIGRKIAINDSVYARTSGRKNESVRIIPNVVKTTVEKDLSAFRSRNVFDFEPGNVTKVSSHLSNTSTSPAQESEVDWKEGKWTLQKPLMARASEAEVQTLLGKILALRAVDFITDTASNLSQYGLTAPLASLSVSVKPDEEIVLQIGNPVPNKPEQVYAQRLNSNSVFTLMAASVDDVMKEVPNVRDRHIYSFDAGKPTAVSFSWNNHKATVRKENGVWKVVGDMAGQADVGKVTDLLTRLSQLETTPVVKDSAADLKPFGLDKPQGKITVESPEFKPGTSFVLLIGKTENQLLYVRNSSEPFIYTIPDNALDFLPAANLDLRDGRAIDLPLGQVKSMTVTSGTQSPIVLTRSNGGTWTASNVKDRMVDSIKAETEASLFCQLQARRWLGPVLPIYGLSKPILTITMQTQSGATTTLRVGASLPEGHAAQVQGSSVAFIISDGDYGLLNSSSLQAVPPEASGTDAPAAASSGAASVNAVLVPTAKK